MPFPPTAEQVAFKTWLAETVATKSAETAAWMDAMGKAWKPPAPPVEELELDDTEPLVYLTEG